MAQFKVRLAERSMVKGKVVVDDYIVFEAEDEQEAVETVINNVDEGDTVEVAVVMLGDGDTEPEHVGRHEYSTRTFNAGRTHGYAFVKGTVVEAGYETKIEFKKPLA